MKDDCKNSSPKIGSAGREIDRPVWSDLLSDGGGKKIGTSVRMMLSIRRPLVIPAVVKEAVVVSRVETADSWWKQRTPEERQAISGMRFRGKAEDFMARTDKWWASFPAKGKEKLRKNFEKKEVSVHE